MPLTPADLSAPSSSTFQASNPGPGPGPPSDGCKPHSAYLGAASMPSQGEGAEPPAPLQRTMIQVRAQTLCATTVTAVALSYGCQSAEPWRRAGVKLQRTGQACRLQADSCNLYGQGTNPALERSHSLTGSLSPAQLWMVTRCWTPIVIWSAGKPQHHSTACAVRQICSPRGEPCADAPA
jgi:hypothetical protein